MSTPAQEAQSPGAAPNPDGSRHAASTRRPRWLTLVLALLALAVVVGGGFWLVSRMRPPELHSTVLQSPEQAANFELSGTDGQPVQLTDLQGKWTAFYFGYSFCPDVCPTTLADLNAMKEALGPRADDVQVVFVSVDPDRDTPERIGAYLKYFNPSFIGMTGSAEQVDAAATQFGVFYEKREVEGASGYLIDHTSTVIVLDPEGRMRLVFPYGVSGPDMASDLTYFMRRG